jgi:hypothetical protein
MTTIYHDSSHDDDQRRRELYDGQLYVYSPRESTQALCEHARQMCAEAFAPHHPQEAQHHLPVEQYASILASLKPSFIHHPESKRLIQLVLKDLSCDMDRIYFDVPRLRTATSDEYLTAGLGYAFKPHRDTWYSPPMCQLNWWLPVFEIETNNCMAFHSNYWNRPVKNSSNEFNYQDWNQTGRKQAVKLIKKDTRRQSEALEALELEPDVRLVCEPGGLIIFSAAHLHSTVPNTSGLTRFSMDFRTVHMDEIQNRGGAVNIDSACTGTTMMDYLRGTDLEHFSDEIVNRYAKEPMASDFLDSMSDVSTSVTTV